jgi:hypothetical protein
MRKTDAGGEPGRWRMTGSRNRLWRCVAIALLSWPLLGTSCVDIAQRSTVNGFFDAFIPFITSILEDRWMAAG